MKKFKISRGRKGKESDTASVASAVSQEGDPMPSSGYTILKPEKELPHKLLRAVWKSNTSKVLLLLEEKTSKGKPKHSIDAVDKLGRTAVHLAVVKGNLDILDSLREHNGVICCQMKDSDGNTPLHKAVESESFGITMGVLKMMDSVDCKNNLGQTALHIAAIHNDVPVANKLLDKGAFPDETDNNGFTSLALAAFHGKVEFAELMIKEECNVNHVNKQGQTPLMLAAMNDHIDVIHHLLKQPLIDCKLKDNEGKTVHDYSHSGTDIPQVIFKHEQEQAGQSNNIVTTVQATATKPIPPDNIDHMDSFTITEEISKKESFISSDSELYPEEDSKPQINITETMRARYGKSFLTDDDNDDEEEKRDKEESKKEENKMKNEVPAVISSNDLPIPNLPSLSVSKEMEEKEDEQDDMSPPKHYFLDVEPEEELPKTTASGPVQTRPSLPKYEIHDLSSDEEDDDNEDNQNWSIPIESSEEFMSFGRKPAVKKTPTTATGSGPVQTRPSLPKYGIPDISSDDEEDDDEKDDHHNWSIEKESSGDKKDDDRDIQKESSDMFLSFVKATPSKRLPIIPMVSAKNEDVLDLKALDFSDEEEEEENVSLSGEKIIDLTSLTNKKAENEEEETDEFPSKFDNKNGRLREKPTATEEEEWNWDTSDEEDEDDNNPQKEDDVPLGQRFFEQVDSKTETKQDSSSDDKKKEKTIENSPKEEAFSDNKADLMVIPSDKPEEKWDWDSTDNEEEEEDDLNEDDLPGFGWTPSTYPPPTSNSQGAPSSPLLRPQFAKATIAPPTTSVVSSPLAIPSTTVTFSVGSSQLAASSPASVFIASSSPTNMVTGTAPVTVSLSPAQTTTSSLTLSTLPVVATATVTQDVSPTVAIPAAPGLNKPLQSFDSTESTLGPCQSKYDNSSAKLPLQTSADLNVQVSEDEEMEAVEKEMLKQLDKTPVKSDLHHAIDPRIHGPVTIATATTSRVANPSLQSLISERKRANQQFVDDSMEQEASRQRQQKENEIFKVLEQRRKTVDAESNSPVRSEPIPVEKADVPTHIVSTNSQQSVVRLMKDKWEGKTGYKNKFDLDKSSVPVSVATSVESISPSLSSESTLPSPAHVSLPLSLPPLPPTSQVRSQSSQRRLRQDQLERGYKDLQHYDMSSESGITSPMDTPEHYVDDKNKGSNSLSPPRISRQIGARNIAPPSPVPSEASSTSPSKQYNELQAKYDKVFETKLQLEKDMLDKELEVRSLTYKLEQMKEDLQNAFDEKQKLNEQLSRAEERLKEDVEGRQSTELSLKEIEVENRSLKITCQQIQEELQSLTSQLRTEKQQHSIKDVALQDQKRLYKDLQEEVKRALEQKGQLSAQLDETDGFKTSLEEETTSLKHTKARLEAELQEQSVQHDEIQNQLETEVEHLREEVSDYKQKEVMTNNALTELSTKVELLTSALDKETETRQSLEEQVSILSTQLASATKEVSDLQLEGVRHDKEAVQQNEQLLREKIGLEKDLSSFNEDKRRLSSQLESVQGKLIATEQELKSVQTQITDKSNQIATLQRQLDQQQVQQMSSQEALRKEQEQVSHLERQVASLNERLSTALSEQQKLLMKADTADKRAGESQSALHEEKAKLNALIESLQADLKKANGEIRERMDQILSVKEQLASSEGSRVILERDIQSLQQERASHQEVIAELHQKLKVADNAYDQMELEKQQVEEQLSKLSTELISQEHQFTETKQMVVEFKEALSKAQKSLKETADERDKAILERAGVEAKLLQFDGKINSLTSELDLGTERECQLKTELEQMNQSRLSLQELATKLRSEAVNLEYQLEQEKSARVKAEQENTEIKEIWESEVKAKHKLTEKFMLLEQYQKESGVKVDEEKRRVRKAIEQKGMAEMKLDSLHERCGQLQRENGELKGQMKSLRKRLRDTEKVDTLNASLKVDLDQTQTTLNAEIRSLQKQVENYREQLRKEAELRLFADQTASRTKLELESLQKFHSQLQSELQEKERALRKSERSLRQLQDELTTMQDHVNTRMVPRLELDNLRRQLEEKSQEHIDKKLTEMNELLEQQSLSFQKMDAVRATQENDRRTRQEKEISDLKVKLNTVIVDAERQRALNESSFLEAKRYKNLYEQEIKKRERLSTKLDRTRERATAAKTQLSLERNQARKLLNTTYQTLSHLSPSTSTPIKPKEAGLSPPGDDLLHSIRSELDRSISKHMDSVSLKGLPQSSYDHSKQESHLDSIRRNYRL